MTDTFDWAGLRADLIVHYAAFGPAATNDLLRTRIEAAFVPVEEYRQLERAHDGLQDVAVGLTNRVEAAEAENAKLLRTLEEIDFEAFNTIPPDGKEAAFAALTRIAKLIDPYRKYK